jgi:hypothetical protein
MEVFVANFGRGNALWEDCKRSAVISTYADKDVHELWRARDREAFIELCMRSKTTAAGKRVTRGVASLWFDAGDTFANTAGDLWLHREGDDLWWTTSRSDPLTESVEAVPMRGVDAEVYVLRKPAEPWQNRDQRGRPLQWSGVHAKARDFLVTVSTVQPLRGSNADYARALVEGQSLDPWHGQSAWRAKEEKSGRSAVKRASPIELSAWRMAQQAPRDRRGRKWARGDPDRQEQGGRWLQRRGQARPAHPRTLRGTGGPVCDQPTRAAALRAA